MCNTSSRLLLLCAVCAPLTLGFQDTKPIVINPGDSIQSAVDAHPPGATFFIRTGEHRLQQVRPKHGNTFQGEPGAVLSGATVLNSFSREADLWVASGQSYGGDVRGECNKAYPRCSYPEDLFIDNALLLHVGSMEELRSGTWYFNYESDKVYLYDDPTNRTVELSVTSDAFFGTAENVTIRGLIIEKYASPAQHGAIYARTGANDLSLNWTIENNELRLNHAAGVRIGHGTKVLRNYIHHNGQLGIGDSGNHTEIEGNEIAFNGLLFDPTWEGGGVKTVLTDGLVVRNNYVHDNYGSGLWCDIDCINSLYEGNTVVDNLGPGIQYEISATAVIRRNLLKNNGKGLHVWLWGAQILIQNSQTNDVYENAIEVSDFGNGIGLIQQDRGSGKYGPHLTKDNYVHHNSLTHLASPQGSSGAVADFAHTILLQQGSNLFDHNTYYVSDLNASHWQWERFMNWSQFRQLGQEPNGRVVGVAAGGWGR